VVTSVRPELTEGRSLVPPAPEHVARFTHDIDALVPDVERLGVAVSGGPDSLALLLLAHAAFPGRIAAATVDHRLRTGSGEEARRVGELCAMLDIPHAILPVEVDTGAASLQQEARRARYGALGAWLEREALPLLATGHHLDDQAETLLMRLLRGAGIGGLAGVRAIAPVPEVSGHGARMVRPLLGWRKAELIALVDAAGARPADDPSNRDPRYDRTGARARLAAETWLDPAALARSAGALGEAEEALAWSAQDLLARRLRREGELLLLSHEGLPREYKRRLLLSVLREIAAGAAPRGAEVDRLLARLERDETATLSNVRCSGGPEWRFERAPPRRQGA
jgi:tRNA(Ile)-lysidine synthase